MVYKYNKCEAMIWLDKRINKSVRLPEFSICYAKGKVILPSFQELPSPLNILLTETDLCSYAFKQNIRMYNSALSFTSIGAKIDQQVAGTSGIYTFYIYREIYHIIGILLPDSKT